MLQAARGKHGNSAETRSNGTRSTAPPLARQKNESREARGQTLRRGHRTRWWPLHAVVQGEEVQLAALLWPNHDTLEQGCSSVQRRKVTEQRRKRMSSSGQRFGYVRIFKWPH